MGAYKFSIYLTMSAMNVSCAFPKEGAPNMIDAMNHPLQKIIKRHKVERHK